MVHPANEHLNLRPMGRQLGVQVADKARSYIPLLPLRKELVEFPQEQARPAKAHYFWPRACCQPEEQVCEQ